ncbi:MAG: MBL fold metallo-hydrolase [Myxococcota bacterium]
MKLRFWGTRGSFAMSGAQYLRYGGNTTAVEFIASAGQRLLIDLGTGATVLAKHLVGQEFGQGQGELPILMTHTHLDHIQGLPFFTPFFIKGNRIRIFGAEPLGVSLTQVFQNQLNPHYSPLNGLENLAAGVTIHTIMPGHEVPVEGFDVSATAVPHGGMWTTAYRITADNTTVVFLTDVEYPDSQPTPEALQLVRGADLLIHDAMYSDQEYKLRQGWGHSSVSTAITVAERSGVERLALFHHNPDSTDEAIDEMVGQATEKTSVPVFAAAEGHYLSL